MIGRRVMLANTRGPVGLVVDFYKYRFKLYLVVAYKNGFEHAYPYNCWVQIS